MALGYPQANPLTYTPFIQTSFGYSSNELQNLPTTNGVTNPFQNATDYVKIIMTVSYQWGDTGHISTPESGDAVAVYDKETSTWTVEGERDHVNAILSELTFYPSRHQPTIDWSPTPIKTNRVNGNYTDESPHESDPITHTEMEMMIYSSVGLFRTEIVWIEAEDVVYANNRPYFSSRDLVRDLAGANYDALDGDIITIGDVDDGGDDDNIEVKCEFLRVSNNSQYTGTGYGKFLGHDDLYVGDKKAQTPNPTDKRFSFIGNKHEVQAFLDNVRYTSKTDGTHLPNQSSFIMKFTVGDGQVGSTYNMLCWNSDTIVSNINNWSTLSYTEDTVANWNLGSSTFANLDEMAEAETFKAILTCDFGVTSGAESFTTTTSGVTSTFINDVLTITATDPAVLLTSLQNLVFTPKPDFHLNFSISIKFRFESATYATSYQSHYTSDGQQIIINATATPELQNANLTYNTIEGVPYDFSSGLYPQIIHPINDDFELTMTFSNTNAASIYAHNNYMQYVTNPSSGVYVITGTKSQVNSTLQNMYLYHGVGADNESAYQIDFVLDRTSRNQDFDPLESGSLTVNVTATSEFTMPVTALEYREDNQTDLDFGIAITDNASLNSRNSMFGADYRMEITMLKNDNSAMLDGTLESTNTGSLTHYGGNGQSGTPVYLQGARADIETALANMKFHPDVDTNYGFKFSVALKRMYGSNPLIDTQERTINGIAVDEYQDTSTTFDWTEETTLDGFDSLIRVIDEADENSDYTQFGSLYQVDFRLKDASNNVYPPYEFYSLTLGSLDSYNTNASAGTFQMTGTKSAINANLANMRFTPQPNTTDSFKAEYRIERLSDNEVFINYTDFLTFNTGTDVAEWLPMSVTNHQFVEDDRSQLHSRFTINDGMTDNTRYSSSITTSTYTVKARVRYTDSSNVEQDVPSVFIFVGGSSITQSGSGSTSNPLTFTGTKSEVNTALTNIQLYGDTDILGAPDGSGGFLSTFFVEYEVIRNYDSSSVGFPTFANGLWRRTIDKAIKEDDFGYNSDYSSSVTMLGNTWTQFSYPNELGLEIKENVAENDFLFTNRNTSYTVEIRGFDTSTNQVLSSANELKISCLTNTNVTGQATNHLTFSGSKTDCNNLLLAIRVATSVDNWSSSTRLQFKVSRTTYGTNVDVISDWSDRFVDLNVSNNRITLSLNGNIQEDVVKTNALTCNITESIAGPIPFGYTGSDNPYTGYENTGYDVEITFHNDNGNRTVEKVVSSAVVYQNLNANNDYVVGLGNTSNATITSDINSIQVNPYRDFEGTHYVSSVWTRKHDSGSFTTTLDNRSVTQLHDEYLNPFDQPRNINEDTENYSLFSYNVLSINDLSENTTDNVTYQVELNLGSNVISSDQRFAYLNSHYLAEDYVTFNDYVVNTKEIYTGTKSEVNSKITNTTLTSLADQGWSSGSIGQLDATIDRYVDGVFDTNFTTNDRVRSFSFTDLPDVATPSTQHFSFDNTWEWYNGSGIKTINDFHSPVNSEYLQIIDTYDEAGEQPLYKVIFTSTDSLTYYDTDGNEILNGETTFLSKTDINNLFDAGMTVYGYATDTTTTVNIEVKRKIVSSNLEQTVFTGSKTHSYIYRADVKLTDAYNAVNTVTVGTTDTLKMHKQPSGSTLFDFDYAYTSTGGYRSPAYTSNNFSPSPPANITVSSATLSQGRSITSNTTSPVRWDLNYSGINKNIKQVYDMTFYAHVHDSVSNLQNESNVADPSNYNQHENGDVTFYNVSSLNNNDYRLQVSNVIYQDGNQHGVRIGLNVIQSNNGVTSDTEQVGVAEQGWPIDSNTITSRQNATITDVFEKTDGLYVVLAQSSVKFSVSSKNAVGVYRISQDGNGDIVVTTIKEIIDENTPWTDGYDRVTGQLSDDLERLVIMRYSSALGNELAIYEKDQGGTDNWGLVTSQTQSTTTAWFSIDTNHIRSFYNGNDNVVTDTGRIYQKDYGGTDNWGYSGDVLDKDGNTATIHRSGFTSEFFFVMTYDATTREHSISLYGHDNVEYQELVYISNPPNIGDTIDGYTVNSNGIRTAPAFPFFNRLVYNKNSNLIYFDVTTEIYYTEGSYGTYAYTNVTTEHSIKLAPK